MVLDIKFSRQTDLQKGLAVEALTARVASHARLTKAARNVIALMRARLAAETCTTGACRMAVIAGRPWHSADVASSFTYETDITFIAHRAGLTLQARYIVAPMNTRLAVEAIATGACHMAWVFNTTGRTALVGARLAVESIFTAMACIYLPMREAGAWCNREQGRFKRGKMECGNTRIIYVRVPAVAGCILYSIHVWQRRVVINTLPYGIDTLGSPGVTLWVNVLPRWPGYLPQ